MVFILSEAWNLLLNRINMYILMDLGLRSKTHLDTSLKGGDLVQLVIRVGQDVILTADKVVGPRLV